MSTTKKVTITLFTLLAIAILGIGVFFGNNGDKSYIVDGPSMAPTFPAGQHVQTTSKITPLQRYDVVVYSVVNSDAFGTSTPKQLIKRIVALPGERIMIKDNKLQVYSSSNQSGFDPDAGQTYLAPGTQTNGSIDVTVPADSYFVLGDNRTSSLDSRSYGPIKQTDIVAKIVRK